MIPKKKTTATNLWLKITWYFLLAFFTVLMCRITLSYWGFRTDVGFLLYKFEELEIPYYTIAFFSHVFSSILVLLAGIIQFSTTVRLSYPRLHRQLGKFYVFTILVVSAPSGFIMAIHANGGTASKISFVLQSVLWFVFTLSAFQSALKRNWVKHREMMIRSFALTLSALSLRAIKWIIVHTLGLPPMDTYRIVAWLGWGINFLIAEYIILQQRRGIPFGKIGP